MSQRTIDLPDWADNSALLSVFHGRELVAYRYQGKPWMVKVDRCARCGECCDYCSHKTFEPGLTGPPICGIDDMKPFSCCIHPVEKVKTEHCKITYRAVE